MGEKVRDAGTKSDRTNERRRRYEPRRIYELADALRKEGLDLGSMAGPWRVMVRALGRPGRNKLPILPIVTNGLAQVMVDTMEHARDLAGLLNWSGVEDLDPVPDLVPPQALR